MMIHHIIMMIRQMTLVDPPPPSSLITHQNKGSPNPASAEDDLGFVATYE